MNKQKIKIFVLSQLLVVVILSVMFGIGGIPNFFGKGGIDDRVLNNQSEKISFTGVVVSGYFGNKGEFKKAEEGSFIIKNEFGKEFVGISRNLDLKNFLYSDNLDEKFFLEGEIIFDKHGKKFFDVEKISKIEKKIVREPKKFFLENNFGGYGFAVDENIFTAVKGGSKTILKNLSGAIILKFFSFDFANTKMVKGLFFSEGGQKYKGQTSAGKVYGEIKNLQNGQEIFLRNKEFSINKEGYGVLIQIDYGEIGTNYLLKSGKKVEEWKKDEEKLIKLKEDVSNFLKSFYFIKKEQISKQRCGGKENLLCKQGYLCELFSTEKSANGRCIRL